MSGLAGILRLDGAPASAAAVAAMTGAMAHRGPDGTAHWVEGPVAMGHLQLRTTTVARTERQPLASADGQLVLTLDGRVDNRDELRGALGADRERLRDDSDAELVLQAYTRWGAAAVARILGDFALVLWDGGRGELVCARDVLGKRPLYYHHGPSGLRWASEPQAVMGDPAIPRIPNLGMIGEHLAAAVRSTSETLLQGLLRLPPAHLLTVRRDGRRQLTRYWSWDPERRLRYAEDRDGIEEFRAIFREAVRVRMDAVGPVLAELSGGLDSSAVVAVAAELRRAGGGAPLDVASLVFPGCDGDESAYIRAMAAHAGVVARELEPAPAGAELYLAQARVHGDLPEPPNMAMHRAHYAAAGTRGTRVVLTGKGGDEWFTGSPLAYADRLRAGRPRRLSAQRRLAREQGQLWPASSPLHQLVRDGLAPLLPAGAQHALRRASGRAPHPAWLPAAFRREAALDARIRTPTPRGPRLAAADLATTLTDGWAVHVAESSERTLATLGLEGRSPFDDRRLVEFALALPERFRQRQGATKWVVRAAMSGLLPDTVRGRVGKAGFREVFFRELEEQGGSKLFSGLIIEELGWVDGARLRRSYDEFAALHRAGKGHPHVWPLWNALSTERWVRATL